LIFLFPVAANVKSGTRRFANGRLADTRQSTRGG
jgi:hypothetical protein